MSVFKNRRILFYMNWLRSGAGMINRELAFAREIVERGGEVTILSHFRPELETGDSRIEVRTLIDTSYRHRWYNYPATNWLVNRKVQSTIKDIAPELVFTDLPMEAERALKLKRKLNYKTIHTYHATADGQAYDAHTRRILDRQRDHSHAMLRASDLALVVSDYLLPEVTSAGVHAFRLYNGVDLDHWAPAPRTTTKPIVLFVGRYTQSKGTLELVLAFIRAASKIPEAELVMHGYFESPSYETEIRQAIDASDVGHRIHMHGPLAWDEMPPAIAQCTVFANGSVDESFCMPFLEAQACARACLGFHARGIPEVVQHELTGLLAPPGELNTFSDYMVRLLTQHEERETFEQAGHEFAKSFSYPRLTDKLETLVEPLLA